jgi:AcrR family transcriptional regulator
MATKKNKRPAREPKYHHGDLRRAITEAALELIEEAGIQNLSLREIARKIGVTTAAPYHHFKDRKALLIEMAIEGYTQLLQTLEGARDSVKRAGKEIEAETRAYLAFARQHAALYAVMFSGELANHNCLELKTIADASFALVCATVGKMGKFGEKETAEAALCVWSMLHGLIVLDESGLLGEERSEQERIAVEGARGILRGFAKGRDMNGKALH